MSFTTFSVTVFLISIFSPLFPSVLALQCHYEKTGNATVEICNPNVKCCVKHIEQGYIERYCGNCEFKKDGCIEDQDKGVIECYCTENLCNHAATTLTTISGLTTKCLTATAISIATIAAFEFRH